MKSRLFLCLSFLCLGIILGTLVENAAPKKGFNLKTLNIYASGFTHKEFCYVSQESAKRGEAVCEE